IAAQLAGEPAIGLAALLEKYLGVKLQKEHQKADWSIRPLTPPMLAYAAADTRFLLALRDAVEQRLNALGRLPWAVEEFKELESRRGCAPRHSAKASSRGASAAPACPRTPASTCDSNAPRRCVTASPRSWDSILAC